MWFCNIWQDMLKHICFLNKLTNYVKKTTALSFTSAVLQTFIMYPDSNNVFLTANTQNKVC